MADLVWFSSDLCEHIAKNSPKLREMERIAAEGIYRIIYDSAPHTTPHKWAYRDNFRIDSRKFPTGEGWVTYLVAERFQWRWIEYGWTEWKSQKKFPGKFVMTTALRAYGWGDTYGEGIFG